MAFKRRSKLLILPTDSAEEAGKHGAMIENIHDFAVGFWDDLGADMQEDA